MDAPNNYNFSIFKPVNEYSRRNRNIIISILVIWFVCIFGFQVLLLILQKPTPEKALVTYETVAGKVLAGEASVGEKQDFAGSLLMVLGKAVKPNDMLPLQFALTQTVYDLLGDSAQREMLTSKLTPLAGKRAELAMLNTSWETKSINFATFERNSLALNEDITQLKGELGIFLNEVSDLLIPPDDAFRHAKLLWLPHELKLAAITEPQPIDKENLDRIMKLYLTHNQSFLTDKKFLGFPFHYFYTAVFLLVLFVGLCIIYAYRIQHLHRRFQMEE